MVQWAGEVANSKEIVSVLYDIFYLNEVDMNNKGIAW
jgi:hypothetical protein